MSLLQIEALSLRVETREAERQLLDGVHLRVERGESVGLIGESGSGKSLTCRTVNRLHPPSLITSGSVRFEGREVLDMAPRELMRYRASEVSMIFQDPRAHINPIHTIGDFLTEGLRKLEGVGRFDANARARGVLGSVGIDDAQRRLNQYPHELSGGLLQRIMIGAVLLAGPKLILADEPTTALDVTTQEEVVAILAELREQSGLSMIFVTHDLDLASAVCDRLVVMNQGEVVEEIDDARALNAARHPYTQQLIASRIPFRYNPEEPIS